MDTLSAQGPNRWVWLLWYASWGVVFFPYIGYFAVLSVTQFVSHWPHATAFQAVIFLFISVFFLLGFMQQITRQKERAKVLRDYERARQSRHPKLSYLLYLVIAPVYPLMALVLGVVWLLTNSLALAVLSVGLGLLLKAVVMLAVWVWTSVASNLPAMGFGYLLKQATDKIRERKAKSRK